MSLGTSPSSLCKGVLPPPLLWRWARNVGHAAAWLGREELFQFKSYIYILCPSLRAWLVLHTHLLWPAYGGFVCLVYVGKPGSKWAHPAKCDTETIRYVSLQFGDKRCAASLRIRNRAEINVLRQLRTLQQNPSLCGRRFFSSVFRSFS